jgi:hypothetical protein
MLASVVAAAQTSGLPRKGRQSRDANVPGARYGQVAALHATSTDVRHPIND